MTAFVSYFWSFVQWDIWIAFEDRKFLCQAEVTFTWTTFVFWRARLYVPFYWKNGALVFEVPNVLGESCAVLVRCLVEALSVVCETLLEGRFRATNVLLNCIITGLDCGFVDDSFLLTLSIEGTIASCLYSCTSLMRCRGLTSRWICCGLRLLISCLLNSCSWVLLCSCWIFYWICDALGSAFRPGIEIFYQYCFSLLSCRAGWTI